MVWVDRRKRDDDEHVRSGGLQVTEAGYDQGEYQ